MTIPRVTGLLMLLLVGYNYINQPLGFSIAGSIALAIFAICLMATYRGYTPEKSNWIGWLLILSGCLILAGFYSFNLSLMVPLSLIGYGYWLTGLPLNLQAGTGQADGSGWGDTGSDNGGSGAGGDGAA